MLDLNRQICIALIAISYRTSQQMSHIRDDLTEKCSALLLGYRRNCAASVAPSQVIDHDGDLNWCSESFLIVNNSRSFQSFGSIHISYHQV